MIHLRALGTLDLRSEDGAVLGSVLSQTKRVALLLYLAAARPRGYRTRDQLVALFWPEYTDDRARRALSQALYVLRRGLGADVIESRGDEVGIVPGTLDCDVVAFDVTLERGAEEEALALYAGELAPGFHLDDAPDFMRWLDRERRRLRDAASEAAVSLAASERARGNPMGAARWGTRALELSPYDESVVRGLMGDLAQAGDHPGAIRVYEAFAERLESELELEPGPETRMRVERIRDAGPEPAGLPAEPGEAKEGISGPVASPALAGPAADTRADPRETAGTRRTPGVAAIGLVISVGALFLLVLFGPFSDGPGVGPATAAAEPPALLAVLPFEDRLDTFEPGFGAVLGDWLRASVVRSGVVEVLPFEPGARRIEGSGSGVESHPDAGWWRATPATHAVRGWYIARSDSVEVHAEVVAVGDRTIVSAIEPVTAPVSDPARALEPVRQRVMGILAARLSPALDVWADGLARPPAYDAYLEYVNARQLGTSLMQPDDWREVIDRLRDAARMDTTFVVPLIEATRWAWGVHDVALADTLMRLARERSRWLTPAERQELRSLRDLVRGDADGYRRAMCRAAELNARRYSRACAEAMQSLGWYREALDVPVPTSRNPVLATADLLLEAEAHHQLHQFQESVDAVRRVESPDHRVRQMELRSLAALGRTGELDRAIAAYMDMSIARERGGSRLAWAAKELAMHGHDRAAEAMFDRAIHWFDGRSPSMDFRFGIVLYEAGRFAEALAPLRRAAAAAAAGEGTGWGAGGGDRIGAYALALARDGDRDQARRLVDGIRERARGHAAAEAVLVDARLAAVLGDREGALRLVREALARGYLHERLHLVAYPDFHPYLADPEFRSVFGPQGPGAAASGR